MDLQLLTTPSSGLEGYVHRGFNQEWLYNNKEKSKHRQNREILSFGGFPIIEQNNIGVDVTVDVYTLT